MFQNAQGQWYDDNYNPIDDPTQVNTAPPVDPGQQGGGGDGMGGPNPVDPGRIARRGGGGQPPPIDPAPTPTPQPSTGSTFQWPTYQLPTPYQFTPYSGFTPFSYDSYKQLTADQAAQEPGYAFANQQGRDAIQTSQASKGNVLSGAALKDLFAWGDQFAGQNYQGAETRNENVYTMNRNNAFNNWAGNETGKYKQWEGNQQYGLPAWIANNQPGQFAANLQQQQAGLTLADLFNRYSTSVDANTKIATAGAS